MTRTSLGLTSSLLAFGLVFGGQPASAQQFDDNYWAEVSYYFPKVNSSIQITRVGDINIGTRINAENDLGFDRENNLPAVLVGVRLNSRLSVLGEYYAISRYAAHSAERDITFDGVTYPASASLKSTFDSDITRLTLAYSIVRNRKFESGVTLGLHATRFRVSIEGETSLGKQGAALQTRTEEFLAPLPTVGAFAGYQIAPRLKLQSKVDYLSLRVGDYKGRLLNIETKLDYRISKNIGIGLAWRRVKYRLDIDKSRYYGGLRYNFKGPALFVRAGF